AFYLRTRKALLHPFLGELEEYNFPEDKLERPYSDFPSSKIDSAVDLCSVHAGRICEPPAAVENGVVCARSDPPNWVRLPDAQPDKILVYLSFPSCNWIVKKAAGIKHMEINGSLSLQRRAAVLKEFRLSQDTFVLLLSNVGTVGLNIAFANIVIVVDNLWSAQENEQLIGRVWRHPQKKRVIVYYLIAENTSDVFLNTISRDKGMMQNAFMNIPTELSKYCDDRDVTPG
ncbi:hypothetical protein OH77DRAFT_1416039, partial [Trametes cingulata]